MRVEFGGFVLDIDRHQLRTGLDDDVHVSPKAFQLLRVLVERRPAVLAKSELHEALWPNVFVSDSRLGGVVVELRHALGERAGSARFIRTVHGVGYAFAGAATVHEGPERRAVEPSASWLALGDTDFALRHGENVLGRDPACDVTLESWSVSRRHARIIVLDAETTIEDLNSKNGTFVGERRVKGRCPLTNGDTVWIGSLALIYCRTADPQAMSTKTTPSVRSRKPTA